MFFYWLAERVYKTATFQFSLVNVVAGRCFQYNSVTKTTRPLFDLKDNAQYIFEHLTMMGMSMISGNKNCLVVGAPLARFKGGELIIETALVIRVTRFGEISPFWQKFKSLGKFCKGLVCACAKCWTKLAIFYAIGHILSNSLFAGAYLPKPFALASSQLFVSFFISFDPAV